MPTIVHTHAARCLVPLTLLVYLQCVPYFASFMQLCCCPSYRAETSIPHATGAAGPHLGDMAGPLKCNPRCSTMSAISFNANLHHRSRNDLDCPQRSRIIPSRCSYRHIIKGISHWQDLFKGPPILPLVEKMSYYSMAGLNS